MELKPCPFCGGDGGITFDAKSAIIFGSCYDCGARSQAFKFKGFPTDGIYTDALEAWNRRVKNG